MNIKLADLLPDVELQPHQKRVLEGRKDRPGKVMLVHGLGSGKTLTALGLAEQSGTPYTTVVPAALRNNMRGEMTKFTDKTTPADVISYTGLAKGTPVTKPQSVIFDEAQRLRNPGSMQAQRAMDLADQARQVTLLSGTPVVNDPGDLAVPVSMLTGKRITPKEFNDRYVGTRRVSPGLLGWLRGVPAAEEPAVKNEKELRRLLGGHVDYYQPEKPTVPTTYEDVETDMSPDQANLYHGMWGKLPWLLRWKMYHNYPMTPDELHRSTSFLVGPRQVGLSTYPFMKGRADPYKAFQGSGKLQAAYKRLSEVLKDERTKALVFSNFIDAGLTPYSAGLAKANVPHAVFHGGLSDVERKKLVDDFNSNRIRVALLGPSGAEGLSFKGTQLVQLLDPYWNSARTTQSAGRALRYDAHFGLPEELRNVKVQRFISKLPLTMVQRMAAGVGFDQSKKRRAADDYLSVMAERKDRRNQMFIDLLKEVGTHKAAGVVAHVAGPSGAGKTTLLDRIAEEQPGVVTKDLDEFDDQATERLGLPPKWKTDYTDDMLTRLADERQSLMDAWLRRQRKPVVLGGHHFEGNTSLNIPAAHKVLLNTPPWLAALRAYRRSQGEEPQYRRRLTELPGDWAEARRDVARLRGAGYAKRSPAEVLRLVNEAVANQEKAGGTGSVLDGVVTEDGRGHPVGRAALLHVLGGDPG